MKETKSLRVFERKFWYFANCERQVTISVSSPGNDRLNSAFTQSLRDNRSQLTVIAATCSGITHRTLLTKAIADWKACTDVAYHGIWALRHFR